MEQMEVYERAGPVMKRLVDVEEKWGGKYHPSRIEPIVTEEDFYRMLDLRGCEEIEPCDSSQPPWASSIKMYQGPEKNVTYTARWGKFQFAGAESKLNGKETTRETIMTDFDLVKRGIEDCGLQLFGRSLETYGGETILEEYYSRSEGPLQLNLFFLPVRE